VSFHFQVPLVPYGSPVECWLPDDYTYLGSFLDVSWGEGATALPNLVDMEVIVPNRVVGSIPTTPPGTTTPVPMGSSFSVARVVVPRKGAAVPTAYRVQATFFSQQASAEAATKRQARLHLVPTSMSAPEPDPGRHVWPLGIVSGVHSESVPYTVMSSILYVEE
jgi:hypothetical protein